MLTYSKSITMDMMFKKASLAALLSICLFFTAIAQDSDRGIERGLNTSGIIGQTDLNDSRLSGMVQPFIRYKMGHRMEGEFSIGLGILNSRDYQTRLLPINYSIHFYPFESGQSSEESLIQRSDIFLYTGLGALNYSHIRIPRPDDPLTVDAGRTIPNSAFWSFGSNWTWQLPIGVGVQLQLDTAVNMNVKAGYTFTGSREIDALSGSNRDGYWSVSFGLSFRGKERSRQTDHRPYPASTVKVTEQDLIKPVSKESGEVYTDLELYFKMRSIPVIEYEESIEAGTESGRVSIEMQVVLEIEDDSTADLAEQSGEVSDLDLYFEMRSIPVIEYDEEIQEGVEQDEMTATEVIFIEQIDESELILLPEPGDVIELDPFQYDEFQMEPSDSDLPKLYKLLDLLKNEPDLNIIIVGRSDNDENMNKNMLISLSRAIYVKNFLVEQGIESNRLRVYSDEIFDTPEEQIGGQILIIRSSRSNESEVQLNR